MQERAVPSVLVVDDDPAMRHFLETLLTHRGWRTVGAATGAEALLSIDACAPGDEFSAALLDAMLPDMRGYDLARRLVGDERTAALPLCFLSGALSGRILPAARVGCILKPALPQQVMAVLQAVVDAPMASVEERLAAIDAVERLSFL